MLFTIFYSFHKSILCEKVAVFNGFCNSGKLLIHNSACTDIGMTYFAVTHLSFGKSNIHTTCINKSIGALGKNFIHVRSLRTVNCVTLSSLVISVTVKYHKHCKLLCHFFIPFRLHNCFHRRQVKFLCPQKRTKRPLSRAKLSSTAFSRAKKPCLSSDYALQMMEKSSTLRLAPPTRPPSISFILKSSAAQSLLTLPP